MAGDEMNTASDTQFTPGACWEWPEHHWQQIVNQVRAGRSLRPKSWPENCSWAVAISFDSDHETNELRDGGQSIGRLAWGEFGARVGVPRLTALLNKHDVRASFYVPAVAAILHKDEQRRLIGEGHEIGLHGWIHELNSTLAYHDERELLMRSSDTIESITGVRPIGMRTPSWDFSSNTLRIAVEMELLYDSSLMADEECYELLLNGEPSGVIELPVEWIRDDAAYFLMHRSQSLRPYIGPNDVFDIFRREMEGARQAGSLFQLTLHPHIIAARSRIWILDELIRHAKAMGGAWFATHAEIAAHVKSWSATRT